MRLGKFKVAREVIFQGRAGELRQIFMHVFPVKIEWDYNGIATYTAICEWFEDLEDGVEPPLYTFEITSHPTGNTTVICKRI